jgi:DNA invertase Pin-like site-specific DNA recombinase
VIRAGIYARYSSDRQNALSIGDQLQVCLRHAESKGWTVVGTYSDAAVSGGAMANRPGLLAALDAADRGEFDLLLTEDEDRIARNLEHLAHVANRLRRAKCYLSTLSTDRVETMHVAFKGLIAEDFLRNLSAKTKRGVRANAERGLATGSHLYGYATQPGGKTEIVEAEAQVIRQIFAEYAGGKTAREIAGHFNVAGVAGPRGGAWNASSINGSRQRGNGILYTEQYVGVKVWNRMDVVKDPFTGKRTPKMRPESEWKRTPVPELRIVDQDVWAAVRARKAEEWANRPCELVRKRSGIFWGLLKCGVCGSSYTVYNKGRLICAGHRERGDAVCTNSRTIKRDEIEARVLVGLQTRLLKPELVSAYVRAYHDAWRAQRVDVTNRREVIEKRLAEIHRNELRTIDAIERGTATPVMEARMMEREAERKILAAELESMGEAAAPIELHPRAAEGYADQVAKLQAFLSSRTNSSDQADAKLIEAARGLIERIEIKPILAAAGSPYDVTLFGNLAVFLVGTPEHPHNECGRVVVAGASYSRSPTSCAQRYRIAV